MKRLIPIVTLFFLSVVTAQNSKNIDFKKVTAIVDINPYNKEVKGTVEFTFDLKNQVKSIAVDAKPMNITNVFLNDKKIKFNVTDNQVIVNKNVKPKGQEQKLTIAYNTKPKKAMYFVGWDNDGPNQIWTQGQGKYTSNWLPSFDDMNEKTEFDLFIRFDSNYEVIANGKLIEKGTSVDGKTLWHYDMKQPMSSYLVALAIGKYKKYEIQSESGIPIEMYAYQGDDQYAEPTYRFTKQIFDFLEQEIGVPYPWQNYKQVPVKDFLYAGMENTTLTIFSDNLLTDKTGFLDQNYVNVNAHELAHHWFGDLVTETHGTHHWLHEGFATYYALLAEKDVFGENYYYYELYKTSRQLVEAQKTDTIPLMNPKASSLTFYQKGAWALHRLREIIGDKTFKTSVKRYLNTYQFKNVETDNFINIVEQESKKDLSGFVDTWLKDTTFPEEEVKQSLSKNKMCRILFDGIDLDKYNTQPSIMLEYYPVNYELVDAAVEKPEHKYSKAIIEVILNSPPIEAYRLDKIRQYLAGAFPKIPEEYKKGYETLLSDPSYITKESALINLWINFPEDRAKYLDATKGVMGFKDKSLRSLWLALATVTEGYDVDKKNDYFFELIDYTSPKHGFDVRRHAFVFLDRIQGFNEEAIKNLLEATRHHNWRFKKNAKNLLKQLKKNPNYTKWIEKYE